MWRFRGNIAVCATPRAIFISVSDLVHNTRDFPMPVEQNLNPFLGPTGHRPDSANLLVSLNATLCLRSANMAPSSGPLHVLFSLPGIYLPRNLHACLLVIHLSVPM